MKRVVCFGEIMMRLAPEGYLRFNQANAFEVVYGGGEANVSVSLAIFGMDSSFVTKLPDNPIGQCAVNELRKYGVDVSGIVRGGERLGIYFIEKGASQRPSNVVYDRKYSSFSEASSTDFDWNRLFEGADWFHFSGITPAVSDNAARFTLEACRVASQKGITISCDPNYRQKLWTTEKAGQVMRELMEYVDICITNEDHADKLLGIHTTLVDASTGRPTKDGYKEIARRLTERYHLQKVAITLRESISASDNNWAGMLYDGQDAYFSKKYPIHIVDRVGGGDSFAAGLIYSLLNDSTPADTIEFAVAASCLKHTIEGDMNHVTLNEVTTLMKGDGSGRVIR